jgi:hypothetical protein
MLHFKLRKSLVLLMLGLLVLGGCGAGGVINLTPDQAYLKALKHFDGLLEDYLNEYAVQPSTVQAEWDLKIKPIFVEGDTALKAWKAVIGQTTEYQKERLYDLIMDRLLDVLIGHGVQKGGS